MQINEDSNDVDRLLFLSKNIEKRKKRRRNMIFFLIIMVVFVTLESSINGICFFQDDKKIYLYVDLVMYFGVFTITLSEITIQQKKIGKKFQQQIRLRAKMCQLTMYQIFVVIIFLLSLYHIGVQIYFFFFDFHQNCFYFKDRTQEDIFELLKIAIFITFIVIEAVMLCFLIWVVKENHKAKQNPVKFNYSSIVFRSQSDDIVLQFYGALINQN